MKTPSALLIGLCILQLPYVLADAAPISETIVEVLRKPLPSEDLTCAVDDREIRVEGPTFQYRFNRANALLSGLDASREGDEVVRLRAPAAVWLDATNLAASTGAAARVLEEGPGRVVLAATFLAGPEELPCAVTTTIYNDGVFVSEITITPRSDLSLRRGIRHEISATGKVARYLHKRRDTNGMDCYKGALPGPGASIHLNEPTSCLQVFSAEAALAMFTDMGDYHLSPAEADTAALHVDAQANGASGVTLVQHIIHIGADGTPYTLPANTPFTFRLGLAVAPNRLPHPRWRDLRMFIWVGDDTHPYPTDDEIHAAARLGFTLFQMHRLGPPGAPRPPEQAFDRVLQTVHDAGMLFIWTANADLQYRHDPEVRKLVEAERWAQWQGFNYGGRYKASMDAFCDTLATCLAAPNGLADYRVASKRRMLQRYAVDGMYIDDNLAYANCTLHEEHGHPRDPYDALIELHEMNWRRRQVLREYCPHAVLIDHCSHAIVLPVIASFDVHLFGEGYTFDSLEAYQDTFGAFGNMYAQGCLWAGDSEDTRCGAETAYAFDLLTGGGQYSYLDWRLWPEKFPYASGVNAHEPLFVSAYNMAQYYFGMYESAFMGLVDTLESNTHIARYHNRVWNELLVVLANMRNDDAACTPTSLDGLLKLPGDAGDTVVYDIHQRRIIPMADIHNGDAFARQFLKPHQLRLLYARRQPAGAIFHLWGGKRIAEHWDADAGRLSVRLHGPAGLEDLVVLMPGENTVDSITVNGQAAAFFLDRDAGLLHGTITYGQAPVLLEVHRGDNGSASPIPVKPITPDRLTREGESKRGRS